MRALPIKTLKCPSKGTKVSADAAMARLGFGLVQVPRYRVKGDLAEGTLVEVLPDTPPTPSCVSLLYPRNRQLTPRVRVFIDWLVKAFGDGQRPSP